MIEIYMGIFNWGIDSNTAITWLSSTWAFLIMYDILLLLLLLYRSFICWNPQHTSVFRSLIALNFETNEFKGSELVSSSEEMNLNGHGVFFCWSNTNHCLVTKIWERKTNSCYSYRKGQKSSWLWKKYLVFINICYDLTFYSMNEVKVVLLYSLMKFPRRKKKGKENWKWQNYETFLVIIMYTGVWFLVWNLQRIRTG